MLRVNQDYFLSTQPYNKLPFNQTVNPCIPL
jgi:hypothetical protein